MATSFRGLAAKRAFSGPAGAHRRHGLENVRRIALRWPSAKRMVMMLHSTDIDDPSWGCSMAHVLDADQLKTFVAIADTGSFTRAAEIVYKTQSAVSMQMKRLEERVGRPLFGRDGRHAKLTEDGERLLDYARRIVRLNTECIASFAESELVGRVRLGLP